jgi:hypothetical protein
MLLGICHYSQRVVAETDQTVDLLESHHFVAAHIAELSWVALSMSTFSSLLSCVLAK